MNIFVLGIRAWATRPLEDISKYIPVPSHYTPPPEPARRREHKQARPRPALISSRCLCRPSSLSTNAAECSSTWSRSSRAAPSPPRAADPTRTRASAASSQLSAATPSPTTPLMQVRSPSVKRCHDRCIAAAAAPSAPPPPPPPPNPPPPPPLHHRRLHLRLRLLRCAISRMRMEQHGQARRPIGLSARHGEECGSFCRTIAGARWLVMYNVLYRPDTCFCYGDAHGGFPGSVIPTRSRSRHDRGRLLPKSDDVQYHDPWPCSRSGRAWDRLVVRADRIAVGWVRRVALNE